MTTSEIKYYRNHAFTIKGEDSESEEEYNTTTPCKLKEIKRNSDIDKNNSSLNWKIVYSYSSIWKKLNNLIARSFSLASNQIRCTENYIMQSEVTLQSISYNMDILNAESEIILKQLKHILADSYVPLTEMKSGI